jgi:hypothetical protein
LRLSPSSTCALLAARDVALTPRGSFTQVEFDFFQCSDTTCVLIDTQTRTVTNTTGVEEVSRSFNFSELGPRGGINEIAVTLSQGANKLDEEHCFKASDGCLHL